METLKELSKHFEIIVFTASHECYATQVLNYLDPEGTLISYRMYRDQCIMTEEGVHIKDLRVIGNRELKDMVLVDNAVYSFGYQIENGIPIIPYYDNKSDMELRFLTDYLKSLLTLDDLRDYNAQFFKLDQYYDFDTPEKALEELYGVQSCSN